VFTINAAPSPMSFMLTVSKSGPMAAGINCGTDCSEVYAAGTVVTLTAIPNRNARIMSWSGCDAGSGAPGSNVCQVKMNTGKSVTVRFSPK
jgi:Divergent InlB B-repeat domain